MQSASILCGLRLAVALAAAAALPALAQDGGRSGAVPLPAAAGPWQDASAAYSGLLTPAALASAYRIFTTPRALDDVLPALDGLEGRLETPGGWTPRTVLPFEAFGQSGGYDRARMARLYGADRVRVARGPRAEGGRVAEAWTLISPYPDPSLTRLEQGTLLIVLRLP